MEDALRRVVPSMTGVMVCPAGGERYGTLYLCSARTADLGPTEPEQIAALFKRMFCLYEEHAYEEWSVHYVATEYPRWRAAQRPPTKPLATFVEGLREMSEATLAAQRDVAVDLSFLTPASLQVALDGRWNSPAALFRHGDRTYLVEWTTSA